MSDATTHRSSSWDCTGGNLDFITDIAPGKSAVLLETKGPGKITHLWLTYADFPRHETVLRDLILRIYWEGASVPSVEVPLGDFFGLGHALPGEFYRKHQFQLNSAPVAVGQNERALNCYWPMPFHKSARVEIYNNGTRTLRLLYFHVDYELGAQPADSALFHAAFHQVKDQKGQMDDENFVNLLGEDNYVIMETEGRGQYLGCFFFVDSTLPCWWGEGDDMIFIDHAKEPTIYGTGSEDYFNNAWGYGKPFSFPYYGAPLLAKRTQGGEYTTLYRFHVPDPVHFKGHIKVTMECWWLKTQTVGLSSVAFWYQEKPMRSRAPLPAGKNNYPNLHPLADDERWHHGDGGPGPGKQRVGMYEMEETLRARGLNVRMTSAVNLQILQVFGGGAMIIDAPGQEIAIPIPIESEGRYLVEVKPAYALIEQPMQMWLEGGSKIEVSKQLFPKEDEGPFLSVGEVASRSGKLILTVMSAGPVALQAVLLTKV
jgi:hypothetical protein